MTGSSKVGVAMMSAVLTAILCGGCAGNRGIGPTKTAPGGSYGITMLDGFLVVTSSSGATAAVEGVTSVDERGCWTLDIPGYKTFSVVWPAFTRWDGTDHRAVRLVTGTVIRSGDYLKGGGGLTEDVPRSTLNIDPAVTCLRNGSISYVGLGDPAQISSRP